MVNAPRLHPESWNALAVKFDALANGKPAIGPRNSDHNRLVEQAARLFQEFASAGVFPPGWPKDLDITDTTAPDVQQYITLGGGGEWLLLGRVQVVTVPGSKNEMRALSKELVAWRLYVMKWLIENYPNNFDRSAWQTVAGTSAGVHQDPAVLDPRMNDSVLATLEADACRLLATILKPGEKKPPRSRRKRSPSQKTQPLTPRQTEAVEKVADCYGNFTEAAKVMGMTAKTVREHYFAAYKKLGISAEAKLKTLRAVAKEQKALTVFEELNPTIAAGDEGEAPQLRGKGRTRRDRRG